MISGQIFVIFLLIGYVITAPGEVTLTTTPEYESITEIFPSNNQTSEINYINATEFTHYHDYDEVEMSPHIRNAFAKQMGTPTNPIGLLVRRIPCTCQQGICGCCTSMFLSAFQSKACMNITYFPEDFAFEVKMLMNERVLYQNMLSGRNPRPICIHPPRFNFIEVCAIFHDVYFIGRNMHLCLDMEGSFQGFLIFDRSFNCMRIGDQGVKIVSPEEGGGITYRPGIDAIVDAGSDDIEDYDENLIRSVLHTE